MSAKFELVIYEIGPKGERTGKKLVKQSESANEISFWFDKNRGKKRRKDKATIEKIQNVTKEIVKQTNSIKK